MTKSSGQVARRGKVASLAAYRGKRSFFSPQLATLAKEIPRGDEWLHEIKLDGYRILAFLSAGRVRLMSRNGKDWTARFPSVVRALAEIPLRDGVLDGEVVALRPDGTSDFQVLQNLLRSKAPTKIVYYVFDLPFYAGNDIRGVPLVERKHLLAGILSSTRRGPVRFSEHFRGGFFSLRQAIPASALRQLARGRPKPGGR